MRTLVLQAVCDNYKVVSYLLTPWCRVLLEKLTGLQLVMKFPAFHGTRRFITALTSVRHLSLSWANPIQSIYPHPTSWRSVLILSTHLHLGLPSGLLPSGFPTKTPNTPLSSPIRTTCPAHLIILHFITRTILGEQYKSFSFSLCSLLNSPVTSSLLGPNILLNTKTNLNLSFLQMSADWGDVQCRRFLCDTFSNRKVCGSQYSERRTSLKCVNLILWYTLEPLVQFG